MSKASRPLHAQGARRLCHAADLSVRRFRQGIAMVRVPFETIWHRIVSRAGETFVQIRGGEFTYEIAGGALVPDRTNQLIPRSHFEEATKALPLESTVPVQHLRGPSYIYAVLMDRRIRGSDW